MFQLFPHLLHANCLILFFLAELTCLYFHSPFSVVWSLILYITSLHLSEGTIHPSRYAIMHLIFCPNIIDYRPGLCPKTVVGKYLALSPRVAWFLLIHFLPLLGKLVHNGWDFLLKATACGALFKDREQSGKGKSVFLNIMAISYNTNRHQTLNIDDGMADLSYFRI